MITNHTIIANCIEFDRIKLGQVETNGKQWNLIEPTGGGEKQGILRNLSKHDGRLLKRMESYI